MDCRVYFRLPRHMLNLNYHRSLITSSLWEKLAQPMPSCFFLLYKTSLSAFFLLFRLYYQQSLLFLLSKFMFFLRLSSGLIQGYLKETFCCLSFFEPLNFALFVHSALYSSLLYLSYHFEFCRPIFRNDLPAIVFFVYGLSLHNTLLDGFVQPVLALSYFGKLVPPNNFPSRHVFLVLYDV